MRLAEFNIQKNLHRPAVPYGAVGVTPIRLAGRLSSKNEKGMLLWQQLLSFTFS
jgi:hypothetical protein